MKANCRSSRRSRPGYRPTHLEALVAYGARTTQSIRTAIAIARPRASTTRSWTSWAGNRRLEIVASFGEADLASWHSRRAASDAPGDILLVCPCSAGRSPAGRSEPIARPPRRRGDDGAGPADGDRGRRAGGVLLARGAVGSRDAIRSSAAHAARAAGPRGRSSRCSEAAGAPARRSSPRTWPPRSHRRAAEPRSWTWIRSFGDLTAALGFIEGGVRCDRGPAPRRRRTRARITSRTHCSVIEGGFDVLLARSEPSAVEAAARGRRMPNSARTPQRCRTACSLRAPPCWPASSIESSCISRGRSEA